MNFDRRDLLAMAAGVAATSLNACATSPPSPKPLPGATASSVDIHCHVFNARDVPIRKFVELVYLDKIPGGNVLDPTLTFICLIMDAGAPTTQEELDDLRGIGVRSLQSAGRSLEERKTAAVASAIKRMRAGDATFDHNARGAELRSRRINLQNRQWMLQRLSNLRRRRLSPLRLSPAAEQAELDAAARELQLNLDLSTWIDFAFNYTKSRVELTEQLATLSPLQASETVLYTPAMLDIGRWVGDLQTSDIGQQVDIMSLIAARPGKSYAVHAFVPFDPWRAIDDGSVLDTVKDAIRNRGCIGVKLYPPMGFRPMGNNVSTFPPSLLPHHPNGASLVNDQMAAFLQFCLADDVPILAHCSDTQFMTKPGGECANPLNWKQYLDAAPDHRNLRLNLGHFGGPWSTNGWTQTVVSMLGQYPNLYSDLSDASFVLDDPGHAASNKAIFDRLVAMLNPLQPNATNARARIMYGSDWSLLARESNADTYYSRMKSLFCDRLNFTPDERRGFLGKNATNFLGIAKSADGTKPLARQRLEKFRAANGLGMSLFDAVDALTA